MRHLVAVLLELAEATDGFLSPRAAIWQDELNSRLLLGGLGYHTDSLPEVERRNDAWFARSALSFSVERAATGVLYSRLQPFIDEMIEVTYRDTNEFRNVAPDWIYSNPNLLPVLMHAATAFSKQELKRLVGSVSDTGMSHPASERLASLISGIDSSALARPAQVRERIRATTEGIVRDLVGRILLEEFVAAGLQRESIPFRRESDYASLTGVVYDFRADFVVPNEHAPLAFIEVRKSSTRHASLYAKDKMFSAINWKGHHLHCLGIMIVEGPWSGSSLEVMSRVFDYVVPIRNTPDVAKAIRRYIDGDTTVLRWLIYFSIASHQP